MGLSRDSIWPPQKRRTRFLRAPVFAPILLRYLNKLLRAPVFIISIQQSIRLLEIAPTASLAAAPLHGELYSVFSRAQNVIKKAARNINY